MKDVVGVEDQEPVVGFAQRFREAESESSLSSPRPTASHGRAGEWIVALTPIVRAASPMAAWFEGGDEPVAAWIEVVGPVNGDERIDRDSPSRDTVS